MGKKVVIIGASSGIGYALAEEFINRGYITGLTSRRTAPLETLKQKAADRVFIRQMDVTRDDEAIKTLDSLIDEMGGMDIIVLNAGVGRFKSDWESERQTIFTNVLGFAALANRAYHYFADHGGGQMVGISSVSALRGHGKMTAYTASKAFMSNYLEGLRHRAFRKKHRIAVTDIRPGFVQTPMTEGTKGMFWVAPVDVAARDIFRAITRKKKVAYITGRWRLIALMMRYLPDALYFRFI